MQDHEPLFYNVYRFSLISFILAAATGALFRYGLIFPLPAGLALDNIRHAHTHLMFFNWISPPVMAWMATLLVHSGPDCLQSRSENVYTPCFFSDFSPIRFFFFTDTVLLISDLLHYRCRLSFQALLCLPGTGLPRSTFNIGYRQKQPLLSKYLTQLLSRF